MIALIAVSGDAAEVEAARVALDAATRPFGFFDGAQVQSWSDSGGTVGVAWIRATAAHTVEQSVWVPGAGSRGAGAPDSGAVSRGGTRPVAGGPGTASPGGEVEAAFVLGRPIRWLGDVADGTDVVDAERMAAVEPGQLAREIDGRGLVLRLSGATGITVVGDPMGSYPLWAWERAAASRHGASLWITNLPGAFHREGLPQDVLEPSRLAGAISYGSSFDGAPWWKGVRRVSSWAAPPVRHPRLRVYSTAPSLSELAALHRGGGAIDPAGAGEVLTQITRAMGDRAGSDLVVPVSGGKDSRLILAAALKAGLPFRAVTGGSEDSEDFVVGRGLALASGVEHLKISDSQPTRSTAPIETIRMVSSLSSGIVTAADAHFFPHRASELAGTWLSGQAGELSRAFYGRTFGPGTAPVITLKTLSRKPGRARPPLTARAEAGMARAIWGRLRGISKAGADADALGDVYYLTDRMGRHLGGALLHFELGLDYASPLWTRRLLPSMWAGTPEQRQRSTFHDEVTLALVADQPPATRDAFEQAIRGSGEKGTPVEPGGMVDTALLAAQGHVRTHAAALGSADPLWKTLSRKRTLALAERPIDQLDFVERHHVWRLATVLEAWTTQLGA